MEDDQVWLEVSDNLGPQLDDPLAELYRQVLAAVLDVVVLYEKGQRLAPDQFAFVGIRETHTFLIWPTSETSGDMSTP